MLTLAQAKTSRLNRISGVCSSSPEFLQYLNDAEDALLERGNWWGSLKVLRGCVYNSCLVFPRQVSTVLAFDSCGSIPPKNQWFSFDAVLPEHVHHWNRHGFFQCASNMALVDSGTTSVFSQIPCLNDRYIQIYITDPSDVGKVITIFGVDGNGLEILTTHSDGTIQSGIEIVLALPFVQTPMLIKRVDRVIKDVTSHPIYLYQFDGSRRFPLAIYQPSETLPEYRSSRITGGHTCCPSQISALVKLQHVPIINDDDLVIIDNLEALALAIQSLKLSDAYDSAGAEGMMSRAIHSLNLQIRNRLPIDTIPVRFAPQGTAHLRRQKIGSMQ